jgi:fermentation-respiration switch protein FrsA (DUF1100 family)
MLRRGVGQIQMCQPVQLRLHPVHLKVIKLFSDAMSAIHLSISQVSRPDVIRNYAQFMQSLPVGLIQLKKIRWWPTILLIGVIGLLLSRFERSNIYRPNNVLGCKLKDFNPPPEDFFLPAKDGQRLHAWFFAAATNSPRARVVVLFCHGNGGNITSRPGYYKAILETGVSLLTFDYRGYGQSEGSASEEGTYLDAQGAYTWLRQKGYAPENIVVWGESLGGAIATETAVREKVGALAIQSSFTSIADIGSEFFPWLPVRLINRIKYDTFSKLPKLACPVLIMHSRVDGTVRYQHGERNFAAAHEPKIFCELLGDHNDALEADRNRFVAGAEKLLKLIEEQRAKGASKSNAETSVVGK